MLKPFPRSLLPLLFALLFTLLFTVAACAETNTAKPPVEAEPSPLESASAIEPFASICAAGSSTDVAIDEVTETGFSAEDLLAFAEGEHRETIRWTVPDELSAGPESGERELTIVVERAGERARDFDPDTDGIGHGARCWPWLIAPVTVTLQSAGGALNERFEAELYAFDRSVAFLRATTPALELAGALALTREGESFAASSYELRMSFSEHGVTGSMHANWSREMASPPLYWDETFEVAYWGRAHCDASSSYAVELDDSVALWTGDERASAQAGIASANATESITINWEGGGTTTATLSFAATDDGACVTSAAYSSEPYQDLSVRGELELRTEDGRVDARWPGRLTLRGGEGGEVTATSFFLDAMAMPDAFTAEPAELGFPEETRGGHTSLSASCDLSLNESGGNSGTIQLTAADDNSGCDLDADPSCMLSLTFTPLVHGTVLP